ncbi:MAG: hypothetical protein RL385_307 [Pseudomonadota bacterium]|jgi:hypothetical protein
MRPPQADASDEIHSVPRASSGHATFANARDPAVPKRSGRTNFSDDGLCRGGAHGIEGLDRDLLMGLHLPTAAYDSHSALIEHAGQAAGAEQRPRGMLRVQLRHRHRDADVADASVLMQAHFARNRRAEAAGRVAAALPETTLKRIAYGLCPPVLSNAWKRRTLLGSPARRASSRASSCLASAAPSPAGPPHSPRRRTSHHFEVNRQRTCWAHRAKWHP